MRDLQTTISNEAPPREAFGAMAVWLDAHKDAMASIQTTPSCIRLCDITGDGDPKLLVADQNRKLRLYKGINLVSEHALLDTPSAICPFWEEKKGPGPHVPSLAVACGQFIFIYKRLRPHYKFTLPTLPVDEEETAIWKAVWEGSTSHTDACERLAGLMEKGVVLTHQSNDLLATDDPAERPAMLVECHGKLPGHTTTITCMESINKNSDEEGATSCLIVGTENKQIVILDATGFAILVKVNLPSPPVFVSSTGLLDIEYRIAVACRSGVIHMIKNGQLLSTSVELEAQPCALVISGKNLVAGDVGNVLHSFGLKGKKNYSVHMPAAIQSIEPMCVDKIAATTLQLVALANGEVRVYKDKMLMSIMPCNDIVSSMRFGKYSREDNTLVLTFKSGSLAVKILSRNSNFNKTSIDAGPPPEQDIPLNIPKKTKLYVEQTQREKDQCVDMHRIFQRDLCKLRLNTARAYVKVLTEGQGLATYTSTASLRLNVEVQGLGPSFCAVVTLTNTGTKHNRSVNDPARAFICDTIGGFMKPVSQLVYRLSFVCHAPVIFCVPRTTRCTQANAWAVVADNFLSWQSRVQRAATDGAVQPASVRVQATAL